MTDMTRYDSNTTRNMIDIRNNKKKTNQSRKTKINIKKLR